MKILEVRATRGPSYWSVWRHKLIIMKLDLEELEESPTNKIKGFPERLKKLIPSLYEHRCSEGVKGGFFQRLDEGTWMGHVIEHIALELQTLAGLNAGFGRTRGAGAPGVYNVVYSYVTEKAGRYAGEAAVRIAETLIKGKKCRIEPDIEAIRELYYDEYLGPSTTAIVDEAERRGIPVFSMHEGALVQFGYGAKQKRIRATITGQTSNIAVDIAGDKDETKRLLDYFNLPVPKGEIVYNRHDLKEAIENIGYPIVIKPLDGNQGKGATINVNDWPTAIQGLLAARKYSQAIIVEKFITGRDYRLLVINKKLVAAALRTPAMVKGNGTSTIKQLIDEVNADPRRGSGHEKVLTRIKVDGMTKRILRNKSLTLNSVLPAGEILYLKDTANLSTGGTSTDVTELVHPENIFLAEQVAQIIGLDICGIDVMTADISQPIRRTGGAVLEVNAAPGFRMHTNPAEGKARNVAAPVLDMLFPEGEKSTIPIVAVTGTNGKTTTIRLVAHMAKLAGHTVGYTNTDGIYINEHLMEQGDCSGPGSASFVLKNPSVDFAVLECARGGILRSGLGFNSCNVAVVTNVEADHLGIEGVETLDDLARVKAVLPETVLPEGYAVLNADDDRVHAMGSKLECKVALFSMDSNNPRIINHTDNEGLAAVVENGYITILNKGEHLKVEKVENIPLTLGGRASFMTENVLAAVLAGYASGFNVSLICAALKTFIPSPQQTPGRLNLFQLNGFEVMIDYAHNPAGMRAIQRFLMQTTCKRKVGIITGVGDRRSEDIVEMGQLAGQMFSDIIIRRDKDLRGRDENEMINLLKAGIAEYNPNATVEYVPNELDALLIALERGQPGDFIFVSSEKPADAIAMVERFKENLSATPACRTEEPKNILDIIQS